jgi:hypothetical protein
MAEYRDHTIIICNPWNNPFLRLFYEKDILAYMFILVFAHEMVHAWQDEQGIFLDRHCDAEAHANAVCVSIAEKYRLKSIYDMGVGLLKISFGVSDLLKPKTKKRLPYFEECYVKRVSRYKNNWL